MLLFFLQWCLHTIYQSVQKYHSPVSGSPVIVPRCRPWGNTESPTHKPALTLLLTIAEAELGQWVIGFASNQPWVVKKKELGSPSAAALCSQAAGGKIMGTTFTTFLRVHTTSHKVTLGHFASQLFLLAFTPRCCRHLPSASPRDSLQGLGQGHPAADRARRRVQLLRTLCEGRTCPSVWNAGQRSKKPLKELPTPCHIRSPHFSHHHLHAVTIFFYQSQFYVVFQQFFSSICLTGDAPRIILTFCPRVLPPWTLCKCQCCLFCCFGFYKNVTVCFSVKHQFWKLWEGSHEGGIIQPHSRAYESTNRHTVSLNS